MYVFVFINFLHENFDKFLNCLFNIIEIAKPIKKHQLIYYQNILQGLNGNRIMSHFIIHILIKDGQRPLVLQT